MNTKIKGICLLASAAVVAVFAMSFFSNTETINVSMPVFTQDMVNELQAQKAATQQKRANAQAARERAETVNKVYSCKINEDCIIVDKDPCGCLRGPEGVTAINAEFSLEFSKLMEKEFATAATCPSEGSTVRECSASAQPVCEENRCRIVW